MRRLVTILLLVLCAAAPVRAATIEDRIAAELQAQGYEILEINRTWLGRLRILAENDEIRREIVFNPGTGEILRDYSVLLTLLEQRDRLLATGSKPARAAQDPVATTTATATSVPGGDAAASVPNGDAGSADPAKMPASDDAATGQASQDVVGPSTEDDPGTLLPLLPAPLLPAAPPTEGE